MPNPLKANILTEILPLALILLSGGLSLYFYQNFPEQVVTHWNIAGEPDGYSGKTFAAFFFPIFILIIYLVMLFIPNIDPHQNRYQEFSRVYHIIKALIITFLVLIYIYIGLAGLGLNIPINQIMPGSIGLLLMIFGYYLPKIKPNWFLGIRTPWTLSSENTWAKTHILGGKIFLVGGLLITTLSFIRLTDDLIIMMFFTAIIFMAIIPVVYSYWIYRQEKKS